jgi:hypothetical protein
MDAGLGVGAMVNGAGFTTSVPLAVLAWKPFCAA